MHINLKGYSVWDSVPTSHVTNSFSLSSATQNMETWNHYLSQCIPNHLTNEYLGKSFATSMVINVYLNNSTRILCRADWKYKFDHITPPQSSIKSPFSMVVQDASVFNLSSLEPWIKAGVLPHIFSKSSRSSSFPNSNQCNFVDSVDVFIVRRQYWKLSKLQMYKVIQLIEIIVDSWWNMF